VKTRLRPSALLLLLATLSRSLPAEDGPSRGLEAQAGRENPVLVRVHAGVRLGEWRPVWTYFGYDEPNYTYSSNGKKLLGELHDLSPAPVYVRVHNLLTSGDGTASLKWGSTNAYSEDANGGAIYDWRIVDRIFDAFHDAGLKPLVEVGFMPEALSTHPQPYRHAFPQGSIFTGWAYPPKDYAKWEELVYQFAKHLRERYGDTEARSWLWEVWNEPDINYWKGTREEFFKLYDYAAAGILRALPDARIGGPDTTGAAGENAEAFLRAFLQHCARDGNAATGKTGAPLSFISWHPKGSPVWKGDHVQMRLGRQLLSVERGFRVVAEFPEWKRLPIILGEWDPEGCAACSAKSHPENAYRNTSLYAAYTAEALKDTVTLAEHTGVNLAGVVTWSFEFESQPYFAGFRELATNGIDKPVLNTFRMLGMLGGERVQLESTAAAAPESVLDPGSENIEGLDGIATRRGRELDLMVWHYQEEDAAGAARTVRVEITGLPVLAEKLRVEQFRVDRENSNSFEAWKKMGSPESPRADEYAELERAGRLSQIAPPRLEETSPGNYVMTLELPQQSVALVRMRW